MPYDLKPLTLGTFLDIYRCGHKLEAHCHECWRFVEIDLKAMVERGEGGKPVARKPICSKCGRRGRWILH